MERVMSGKRATSAGGLLTGTLDLDTTMVRDFQRVREGMSVFMTFDSCAQQKFDIESKAERYIQPRQIFDSRRTKHRNKFCWWFKNQPHYEFNSLRPMKNMKMPIEIVSNYQEPTLSPNMFILHEERWTYIPPPVLSSFTGDREDPTAVKVITWKQAHPTKLKTPPEEAITDCNVIAKDKEEYIPPNAKSSLVNMVDKGKEIFESNSNSSDVAKLPTTELKILKFEKDDIEINYDTLGNEISLGIPERVSEDDIISKMKYVTPIQIVRKECQQSSISMSIPIPTVAGVDDETFTSNTLNRCLEVYNAEKALQEVWTILNPVSFMKDSETFINTRVTEIANLNESDVPVNFDESDDLFISTNIGEASVDDIKSCSILDMKLLSDSDCEFILTLLEEIVFNSVFEPVNSVASVESVSDDERVEIQLQKPHCIQPRRFEDSRSTLKNQNLLNIKNIPKKKVMGENRIYFSNINDNEIINDYIPPETPCESNSRDRCPPLCIQTLYDQKQKIEEDNSRSESRSSVHIEANSFTTIFGNEDTQFNPSLCQMKFKLVSELGVIVSDDDNCGDPYEANGKYELTSLNQPISKCQWKNILKRILKDSDNERNYFAGSESEISRTSTVAGFIDSDYKTCKEEAKTDEVTPSSSCAHYTSSSFNWNVQDIINRCYECKPKTRTRIAYNRNKGFLNKNGSIRRHNTKKNLSFGVKVRYGAAMKSYRLVDLNKQNRNLILGAAFCNRMQKCRKITPKASEEFFWKFCSTLKTIYEAKKKQIAKSVQDPDASDVDWTTEIEEQHDDIVFLKTYDAKKDAFKDSKTHTTSSITRCVSFDKISTVVQVDDDEVLRIESSSCSTVPSFTEETLSPTQQKRSLSKYSNISSRLRPSSSASQLYQLILKNRAILKPIKKSRSIPRTMNKFLNWCSNIWK